LDGRGSRCCDDEAGVNVVVVVVIVVLVVCGIVLYKIMMGFGVSGCEGNGGRGSSAVDDGDGGGYCRC